MRDYELSQVRRTPSAMTSALDPTTPRAGGMLRRLRERLMPGASAGTTALWWAIGLCGSAVALTLAYLQAGPSVLLAVLPTLGMVLLALHVYIRRQRSRARIRQMILDAAPPEAPGATREREAAIRPTESPQESGPRFHAAFTHAHIAMLLTTADGHILQVNRAFCELLGLTANELVSTRIHDRVIEDDRAQLDHHLGLVGTDAFQGFSSELSLRRRDGQVVWTAVECGVFTEPGTARHRLILQVQDVTERRQAEANLQFLAYHDSLTGLPNRRRFLEVLDAAIARSKADRTNAFALLFVDFDGLKAVNEAHGHPVGDDVLSQVAWRLQLHLRPGDVLARLGGDEFGLLVQVNEHGDQARVVAERLDAMLREPFEANGIPLRLIPSIGMTQSSMAHGNGDEALRAADAAMRQARSKRGGEPSAGH